jgi:hypothetical protein
MMGIRVRILARGCRMKVCSHHSGNGAAGADGGDSRVEVQQNVAGPGSNAAEQVEQQVAERPQLIFHVVAEDIQRPHVAQDVPDPAVQEHERDKGEKLLRRGEVAPMAGSL